MPAILPGTPETLSSGLSRRKRVLSLAAAIVILQGIALFWSRHPDRPLAPVPQSTATERFEADASPPSQPPQDDPTPLLSAVRSGQTINVQRMLASGANVHQIDRQGHTALLLAVESGREDIVQLLLAHGSGERDLRGPRWGIAQSVKVVPGASPQPASTRAVRSANLNQAFLPPLVLAAKYGNSALMQYLLKRRRTSLLVREREVNGCTALHYAVRLQIPETSLEFTGLLLQQGADANAQDQTGKTPLMQARSLAVLNLLIAHGADVNARDSVGNTVLMQNSSPRVAAVLIAHGADVNAHNRRGDTPLMTAIRSSDTAAVAYLLQQGAHADIVNQVGETPLLTAQATRYAPMITLLVNAGAKR